MHIPADISILVADYGVGDHYIVAAFAEAICHRYGVRVYMAGRGDMSFLASLFPKVDRYLLWRNDLSRAVLQEKTIKGGAMFDAHFPGLELMRAVGYRDFHFLDAYRCRFGLAASATLSRPHPPLPAELAETRKFLETSGIHPGNFVFLCADTRSTPTDGITLNFWQALAENLKARALTPVFNVRPETVVPEPAIGVTVPLHLLRSLVMLSAGVCTARSGLSELFCDLPRPQAVVYADVQYWAGSLRTGTTFEKYGLAKPPLEWTVTPQGAHQAAQEIAESFSCACVAGELPLPTFASVDAVDGC
jgi:hypothetical protein